MGILRIRNTYSTMFAMYIPSCKPANLRVKLNFPTITVYAILLINPYNRMPVILYMKH